VGISGISHVGVTTSDLDRAKRFYGDLLGLALRGEGEEASEEMGRLIGIEGVRFRWAEYRLGRGQVLELLQYLAPEGTPLEQRTCDPGSSHLGFEVDDVDAMHARLVAAGVTVRSEPVLLEDDDEWTGYRAMYALDPDGFTVEFLQAPGEQEHVSG
jgi:catechol 2,3-dioxygenase-like lactoylglutathione lyase family enzyme